MITSTDDDPDAEVWCKFCILSHHFADIAVKTNKLQR